MSIINTLRLMGWACTVIGIIARIEYLLTMGTTIFCCSIIISKLDEVNKK